MRGTILISLICFCHLSLVGQSAEEEVIRLKQSDRIQSEEPQSEEPQSEEPQFEEPQSLDEHSYEGQWKDAKRSGDKFPGYWNMSLGTGYSYMKGFGSGMMFFAAPTYTLPLNSRWAFHGGMLASQHQGLNGYFSGESVLPASYFSLSVFAAASYRMNDRLILHGTGVKQLLSSPVAPFTPYPMDNLSLGATYKLGENISIGATIHMNNGRGYYATPFGGHSFQSPFFW